MRDVTFYLGPIDGMIAAIPHPWTHVVVATKLVKYTYKLISPRALVLVGTEKSVSMDALPQQYNFNP